MYILERLRITQRQTAVVSEGIARSVRIASLPADSLQSGIFQIIRLIEHGVLGGIEQVACATGGGQSQLTAQDQLRQNPPFDGEVVNQSQRTALIERVQHGIIQGVL